MRLLPVVLAALLGVVPPALQTAWAQQDPPQESQPKPRTRMTWQQRFDKANTTGDGKLTLEQAKAGYPTIARNFARIDLDGRGFVTRDDVKAWHKSVREARNRMRNADDDPLRPRTAYQRTFLDPRAVPTAIIGPQRPGGPQPVPADPAPDNAETADPADEGR